MKRTIQTPLKTVFILVSCFAIFNANAQNLIIQYDFLKDDYAYFKSSAKGVRSSINKPIVSRNHNVKVEVINFNPFLYTATASFNDKVVQETPSLNFLSLISPLGLSGGSSGFLNSLVETKESARGGLMASPDARKSLLAVEASYAKLQQAENVIMNINYVARKVHQLKLSPYLQGDSIKSFATTMIKNMMKQETVSTQDFLIVGQTIAQDVSVEANKLKSTTASFMRAYQSYAETRGKSGNFEGQDLDEYVKQLNEDVAQFSKNFSASAVLDKLDILETEYMAIMNTPYQFNANTSANSDGLDIELDFFEKQEDGSSKKIKSKTLEATTTGDLKINSSVGLAFPFYKDNNNYINKDSVITSVAGNNYTPNIGAYLNFYPYTGRVVQVGGTFGVGMPISADSRNFNFLMGGSVILGTNNRVILHGGATLGQKKTLDDGFKTGENLGSAIADVPVKSSYAWGGFAGISFSLINIKN